MCYNNIANLHYKNEKYQLAADSYNKAVHMALVCLNHMSSEDFYEAFEDEKPKEDLKHKKNTKEENNSVDNEEAEDKKKKNTDVQ